MTCSLLPHFLSPSGSKSNTSPRRIPQPHSELKTHHFATACATIVDVVDVMGAGSLARFFLFLYYLRPCDRLTSRPRSLCARSCGCCYRRWRDNHTQQQAVRRSAQRTAACAARRAFWHLNERVFFRAACRRVTSHRHRDVHDVQIGAQFGERVHSHARRRDEVVADKVLDRLAKVDLQAPSAAGRDHDCRRADRCWVLSAHDDLRSRVLCSRKEVSLVSRAGASNRTPTPTTTHLRVGTAPSCGRWRGHGRRRRHRRGGNPRSAGS